MVGLSKDSFTKSVASKVNFTTQKNCASPTASGAVPSNR